MAFYLLHDSEEEKRKTEKENVVEKADEKAKAKGAKLVKKVGRAQRAFSQLFW